MALDDLYKSLEIFQGGMQKLAINDGIQQATQQVDQINQSQMDELQKRQARTQLAQQLALHMNGIGADASHISLAQQSIAPAPINNAADAYQQAVSSSDPKLMKMAKDMQKFEEDPKMAALSAQGQNAKDVANINGQYMLQAAGMKADRKLSDEEFKTVKDLGKQFETASKDLFSNRQMAQSAITMLNSDNPVANKSVLNQLVKASGDRGNISEADRAGFGGSEAYIARAKRAASQAATGLLDNDSKKFLLQVAEIYRTKSEANIHEVANRFAKRGGKLLNADPATLRDKIFPGFDGEPEKTPPPAGPARPTGVPAEATLQTRKSNRTGQMMKVWVSGSQMWAAE